LASLQDQILSRSRLEAIIDKSGLYAEEKGRIPMEALVDRFHNKITVTPLKPMQQTTYGDLPGFTLKVAAPNAQLAQTLCNELSALFMEENRRTRQEQTQGTTTFLNKQLEDAKAKLDERDARLAAFKGQYVGELPSDQQTNLALLAELNSQLEASNQALARAQQDKAFAESMLSQQLAAVRNGESVQSPDKQLSDMQSQLAALRSKYTEDHPDVAELKDSIEKLKQKLAASDRDSTASPAADHGARLVTTPAIDQLRAQVHQHDAEIKERTAKQHDIQKQINLYQGRVQISPTVEEQYKQLTRDYQSALDFYNDLLKKRNQSAMQVDLQGRKESGLFRVLDPPSFPVSPSFPKTLYFISAGLGAGLFMGFALALLQEVRDKTLRTEQDIDFFLQVPTLVQIPSISSLRNYRSGGKEAASGLGLTARA
jgi:polysaccharide chain length determinant protein (PEP-CTERM system associated)